MPYVFEHFMLDPGTVVRFLKVQEQCALLELTCLVKQSYGCPYRNRIPSVNLALGSKWLQLHSISKLGMAAHMMHTFISLLY